MKKSRFSLTDDDSIKRSPSNARAGGFCVIPFCLLFIFVTCIKPATVHGGQSNPKKALSLNVLFKFKEHDGIDGTIRTEIRW